MLVGLLAGLLVVLSPLAQRWDGQHADLRQRLLRVIAPVESGGPVIVIGIDEADLAHFPEPIALWHVHLARLVAATADGGARALGIDVALPDRSFETVLPGLDDALLRGLLASKQRLPVVLAQTLDANGQPRTLPRKLELVAGANGIGLALFPRDGDGVVRRFDEGLAEDGSNVPTLAGQVARAAGLATAPGWIDFTRGADFSYLPLREVLGWADAGDQARLSEAFSGRIVLLGSVLPWEDRVPQPLSLAGWESRTDSAPGVLLHAQALRNMAEGGLVTPVAPLPAALLLLPGLALAWLASSPVRAGALALAWLALLIAAGTIAWRLGFALPTAAAAVAGVTAIAARAAGDASLRLRERRLLRRAFGTAVSPSVMQEILVGSLHPQLGGERRFLCILFSDIRGFTTLSESMTPEDAISLLNRYFDRVVGLIHAEGGAVVNFMGDGIMAIFGAPKPLANPCDAGFRAARAMQAAVEAFSRELAAEGRPGIEVGVGLHAGEAVVGFMGAANRSDFTAIGDACNVASRVEGLTKAIGFRIAVSDAVVAHLSDRTGLERLGPQAIKGHTPVMVHGWGRLGIAGAESPHGEQERVS
jgi:adenylate cyclase